LLPGLDGDILILEKERFPYFPVVRRLSSES
jgi:hypothetical protein